MRSSVGNRYTKWVIMVCMLLIHCAGYRTQNNGFTTIEQKNALAGIMRKLASVTFYLAEGSAKVMVTAMRCFMRFMLSYDHELIMGQDIPDVVLCESAVWMALSLKHKSIRTYLSMGPRIIVENQGIKYKEISDRPYLARVLKAIDRIYGKATKRKTPVTVEMLYKMAKHPGFYSRCSGYPPMDPNCFVFHKFPISDA